MTCVSSRSLVHFILGVCRIQVRRTAGPRALRALESEHKMPIKTARYNEQPSEVTPVPRDRLSGSRFFLAHPSSVPVKRVLKGRYRKEALAVQYLFLALSARPAGRVNNC